MTSIKSIKDRLKKKSIENGKTMQEMPTLYGLLSPGFQLIHLDRPDGMHL